MEGREWEFPIEHPCDGIATFGCAMEAGDTLVRGTTGGVHSQPATGESTGLVQDAVVYKSIKLGSVMQP